MNMNGFYGQIDGFFAKKDFAGAEAFMQKALEQAERENDIAATVTICNELGGFYRAFSRYNEGIPLYKKALECLRILKMENTDAHGTTLINFATTLAMTGHNADALDAYKQAAEIFGSGAYARDYRLATLYNNMSSLYQNMHQLDEAEEYLHKAMEILDSLEDSDIEVAITWSNLAGVYLAMGSDRLADARNAAEKAVDRFTKTSGDQDVHFAAAVTVLGDVCYREDDYEKAAELFRQAMELTKRDYGNQTAGYAVLCDNLAQTLQALGRAGEAAKLTAEAASIRERMKR